MQCWLSVQVYTSWLWQNKAFHITEDSTPFNIFTHFFPENMHPVVEEIYRYYNQYFNTLDEAKNLLPMMIYRKHYYLLLCRCGMSRETQWNITNPHYKFLRPLSETKWNMTNSTIYWDIHILDNKNELNKTDENYEWLQKWQLHLTSWMIR